MRFIQSARPSVSGAVTGLSIVVFTACGSTESGAPAAESAGSNAVDQAIQALPIATPQSGAVVASQGAAVSQNIGQAQITVVFNRPVARGREVFGNLVPLGDVWHPGADQGTYLRTTADILFAGELLPAGSYSIWAVPNDEEWEIILHKDWKVFHLPFPGDEGVQLRTTVTPQTADHMESMAFYFPVADRRSGVLAFHWADTKLEIEIEAPGPDTP